MHEFFMNKDSHFILYGAASFGSVLYQKLTDQGALIDAYIDQRAEEICRLMGVPVYRLSDIANYLDVSKAIVIVSVKNVFAAHPCAFYAVFGLPTAACSFQNEKGQTHSA